MNEEFKLHSRGENWFHFRKYSSTTLESFSITYCHDGTVCMTGDYGCLCWQRQLFPEKLDYGFPDEKTFIGYFAQKIVRAEEAQKIRTWKRELAIEEIKETLEEYRYEKNEEGSKALECILDQFEDGIEEGDYGQIQMIEAFYALDYQIEGEVYCDYGRCYTNMFIRRFEMLQSVSDQILENITEIP